MSGFTVEGNVKLKGSIRTAGNKNEALPLIAASLLCDKPVVFENMPDIGDVQTAYVPLTREQSAGVNYP